jgi:pyruvate formate lyase activating enzyme
MSDLNAVRGIIFDIQRYSVHDGPGIRTIVFLKGCPLRCKWCSNPESYIMEPQSIMVRGESESTGREVTVGEVVDIVLKDMVYYRRSKSGGVTLSGGEPLFQPKFASSLLNACKLRGVHTAIETSALSEYVTIETLLPWLDLIMMDIKST